MSTGLVATQTITHATPAAFGSHVPARKCENQIALQYITESRPDSAPRSVYVARISIIRLTVMRIPRMYGVRPSFPAQS
jgi:hypothetical protein